MRKLRWLLPGIITFIVLGIIYYFNNLYPFGINHLVQVDADYQYIPILYKIYDLLHSGGSLFYSDIGLGNCIYGSLIIQGSVFNPLNLLLLLIKKSNIVNFFGLYVLIKICLISLTCYFYVNKKFKINYFYKLLFSVLYAFNGFVVLNYFNYMWLDIVILFPLIVYYLEQLLENSNRIGYILILSLCFIISFYFSIFVVVFILFYSFVYLFIIKRENIKTSIFDLGICTLISFLISAFSSIPLIYQILNSSRFNQLNFTQMFSNIQMKSLYILFIPFYIIFSLKLFGKYKSDKKNIYFYLILIFLYFIPVVIDPINCLMHGGGFWNFPYRYGFITSFLLMNASLYYLENFSNESKFKISFSDIAFVILIIILGSFGMYLNFQFRGNIITDGILLNIKNDTYIKIVYIIIIIFFMSILSLYVKNRILKYFVIGAVGLYSIFTITSWTFYYASGYYLSSDAEMIRENIKIDKDGRYKVDYKVHTPDLGFIYEANVLDNWLHILPKHILDVYDNLGYLVDGTSVNSYGGTLFSDYLLNFKYMFSDSIREDNLFSKVDEYDNTYLYNYNYDSSFGILFNELPKFEFINKFDYQNDIYHNLFNEENDIISYDSYGYITENNYVELEYDINDMGYLYFDTYLYDQIDYILINDSRINSFGDYIKFLGKYDDDVKIKIFLKDDGYFWFYLGFIKKDDILKLPSSNVVYENNKYYVNNTGDNKYLFLPINNIKGTIVYNNGIKVETINYLDNFICIKLNSGENVISIKYEMPLFKISIFCSMLGVLLLFFLKKINVNNIVYNMCYYLYIGLVIFIYLYYYFYSLFKYIL